ncbi:DUF4241 domain-containing protein [Hymenobacter taeanensis]|uniref:DUF4241 domain-containing protein n=1 Tax=Hymenobacter taeanensis TaxID=2735321 RepID=A0A6M6BE87_9BACT|nr:MULTISPECIES: DUF4241 domain-containing protein [Hymenobacter]QJX46546.1 DUF4241 domain-containing protein [Hymenobacter taeanensis]UOQ80404.1 DUF4241 domain-containing protein [Hymenobacter sp. 5414T-23]
MRRLIGAAAVWLALGLAGCTKPIEGTVLSPGRMTLNRQPYQVTAKPEIFESSFFPDAQVAQDSLTFRFYRNFLGNLPINSGRVVACEPLTGGAQAFTTLFPKGRFPVELTVAQFGGDERVAFARILFSEAPVVKWEPALLPGQQPLPLFGEKYYGYPVDGGTGLFIDAHRLLPFTTFLQDNAVWEQLFIKSFRLETSSPLLGLLYATPRDTVATFSTGLGDGTYASYVGLDAQNRPCRLLTDFQLINWQ